MADKLVEKIDGIRSQLTEVREDLVFEHEYEFSVQREICVDVEGFSYYPEIEINDYLNVSMTDVGGGAVEASLGAIEEVLDEMELEADELRTTISNLEKRIEELEATTATSAVPPPAPARLPDPGYGVGGVVARNDPSWTELYEPPPGYEWTGEFRPTKFSEFWLTTAGSIGTGPNGAARHLLRKTRKPWPGSDAASCDFTWSDFPTYYYAPPGFEFKGEWRPPKPGELYLDGRGRVARGPNTLPAHVLRALPGTPAVLAGTRVEIPADGSTPAPSTPARRPWPGTDGANALGHHAAEKESWAEEYDPPTGYEYTGDFRNPMRGELFLSNDAWVIHATDDRLKPRHILRALPGTPHLPSAGKTKVLAATAGAAPTPAEPEFERPKEPTPV